MPATKARPEMPAQYVATLARHADMLAHYAELAIKAMRSDLAVALLREARAVLVKDLALPADRCGAAPDPSRAVAVRHAQRTLERTLAEQDREALLAIVQAAQPDNVTRLASGGE
jgi:hypothetical protein